MEGQIQPALLNAYVETRVDLEPLEQDTVVQVQTPSTTSFSLSSRSSRHTVSTSAVCSNESTFSRTCLANASSIYFSRLRAYPRNFLWRVLDKKTLELRSIDLAKDDREDKNATVILQLGFPSAIRTGGVAFADDREDGLNVFVLTKSNELFTLAIATRFFYDVTASEGSPNKWCKAFKPSSFTIASPHRLIAANTQSLIITLDDGRILRLSRQKKDDGSLWQELAYNDGGWGSSLRGLIPWQGSSTVRYDGHVLDHSTAIAAEFSPSQKDLVTVCAGHTLKIWNLKKGSSVFNLDLLDQQRGPEDMQRMMLDPGNSEILRVFDAGGSIDGDEYYAMTYSPHDGGQFKIWAIRDASHGKSGVRFLYPEHVFRPPEPDPNSETKAVWKMANFKIDQGNRDAGMRLWVLLRSNRRYKLYCLAFDLEDLPEAWDRGWTLTASTSLNEPPLPQPLSTDARDAPDLWLEYLLYPGRYSKAVLETALSSYTSSRNLQEAIDAKGDLAHRLGSAIASQVACQPIKVEEESGTPFEQYRAALQQEWSLLHQEIQDLDRLLWQMPSLSYDERSEMPWLVYAGGLSAIRNCSQLEAISYNTPAALEDSVSFLGSKSIEDESSHGPKQPYELAVLVQAILGFTSSFNPSLQRSCQTSLASELWQDPLTSVSDRMRDFYTNCNFQEEISIPAIESLKESLEPLGGADNISTDHFLALIQEMPQFMTGDDPGQTSSTAGLNFLVKGAQEMINLHSRILSDMLIFIVLVENEDLEKDDQMLQLDTSVAFMAVTEQLKRYELMQWLASKVSGQYQSSSTKAGSEAARGLVKQAGGPTILGLLFAADISLQAVEGRSQRAALTDTMQDLLIWTIGGNDKTIPFDRVLVFIQCSLLKDGQTTLASDFLFMQPCTPWAVYIKGRLCLSCGDATEAALCFQKAAYGMARKTPIEYKQASAGYLTSAEVKHFGAGLPSYYEHIVHLYDLASLPSRAAQFAQLALQFSHRSSSTQPDSSLLTSLFNSSLQTSDIHTAFTALVRLPRESQIAQLPTILKKLLASPTGPALLLELPWPPHLYTAVDRYLANEGSNESKSLKKPPISPERQRKILSAWRLKRGDFRGAASALYTQLQITQKAPRKSGAMPRIRLETNQNDGVEMGNKGLDQAYLSLINIMACIGGEEDLSESAGGRQKGSDEAWLLSASTEAKRKLVKISDVREEWQKELDRRSVVESGRWGYGLGTGDEMDLG
ncbi:MAG: hypothetical protein Q9174_002132 [Haloplaca sp. 1 TL-2023]